MGKNLVDLFFEMLHHQVVLLFSVFVLGLWLEATQFASVSGSEAIDVFGQRRWNEVQHVVGFEILPNLELIMVPGLLTKNEKSLNVRPLKAS